MKNLLGLNALVVAISFWSLLCSCAPGQRVIRSPEKEGLSTESRNLFLYIADEPSFYPTSYLGVDDGMSRLSINSNAASLFTLKKGALLYHGVETLSDNGTERFTKTVWFALNPRFASIYARSRTEGIYRTYRVKKDIDNILFVPGSTSWLSAGSASPLYALAFNGSVPESGGSNTAVEFCNFPNINGWFVHTSDAEFMLCNDDTGDHDSLMDYLELVFENKYPAPVFSNLVSSAPGLPFGSPTKNYYRMTQLQIHWESLVLLDSKYDPKAGQPLHSIAPSAEDYKRYVKTINSFASSKKACKELVQNSENIVSATRFLNDYLRELLMPFVDFIKTGRLQVLLERAVYSPAFLPLLSVEGSRYGTRQRMAEINDKCINNLLAMVKPKSLGLNECVPDHVANVNTLRRSFEDVAHFVCPKLTLMLVNFYELKLQEAGPEIFREYFKRVSGVVNEMVDSFQWV
ncbi:hypothetical protein MP638_000404 [Amoeboaphelidium occidentale]|nr:hypothetical protein MP638_000404 [Amoeboaphelidium occidentale]